jgi:hypothetical protein
VWIRPASVPSFVTVALTADPGSGTSMTVTSATYETSDTYIQLAGTFTATGSSGSIAWVVSFSSTVPGTEVDFDDVTVADITCLGFDPAA